MVQLELDNLRTLLLSKEGINVGLAISENIDDDIFNELILEGDWIKDDVDRSTTIFYVKYINKIRLVMYITFGISSQYHVRLSCISTGTNDYYPHLESLTHETQMKVLRIYLTELIKRAYG